MPLVTKPNTYVAGTTAQSAEVNANEDTLYNLVNGLLDDDNVASLTEAASIVFAGTGHNHTGTTQGALITGGYNARGLTGANNGATPNTKYDVVAASLTLVSSAGNPITRLNTGTLTCDLGAAGPIANGRDQAGAFGAASWVHLYAIWNGAALATLASASAPPTAPTLPTGYTHWAYLCALYFDGASHLLATQLRGDTVFYPAYQSALAAGDAAVETAVSLAALVPPNAPSFDAQTYASYADPAPGVPMTLDWRVVTGTNFKRQPFTSQVANVDTWAESDTRFPNLSQQVFYLWSAATGTRNANLYVRGYQVPNGAS